jgi:hypothetical protein
MLFYIVAIAMGVVGFGWFKVRRQRKAVIAPTR